MRPDDPRSPRRAVTSPDGTPHDGVAEARGWSFEASETARLRTVHALGAALRDYTPSALTFLMGASILVVAGAVVITGYLWESAPIPFVLSLGAALLALLGFTLGMVTSRPMTRPRTLDIVIAAVATAVTLYMSRDMGVEIVVAGALVGVLLGVASLPGGPLDVLAAGSGYAGMVVGMVQPAIAVPTVVLILSGALAGAIFSAIGSSVLPGLGSRMGTSGFLASAVVYVTADLLGAERPALVPAVSGGLPHWAIVPVGIAGALVTWILVNRAGVPFVLASGATSLLVAAAIVWSLPTEPGQALAVAWFGGTFVGGSGSNRLPTAFWIGLAAFIYGALMLHFRGPLDAHAGVIGVTGAIACLATVGIEWCLHVVGAHRWLRRGGATPASGG